MLFGLNRDGLIDDFRFGPVEEMQKIVPMATEDGIRVQPSASGIELFLWAFGKGSENLEFLFSTDLRPSVNGAPLGVKGSIQAP